MSHILKSSTIFPPPQHILLQLSGRKHLSWPRSGLSWERSGLPLRDEERGMQRQRKLDELECWHHQAVLAAFLILLQISLFLFGPSLGATMWAQWTIYGVVICTTALGSSSMGSLSSCWCRVQIVLSRHRDQCWLKLSLSHSIVCHTQDSRDVNEPRSYLDRCFDGTLRVSRVDN